jgi:hypothetical protein
LKQWREVTEFERPSPATERLLIVGDVFLARFPRLGNRPETFRFTASRPLLQLTADFGRATLRIPTYGVIVIT